MIVDTSLEPQPRPRQTRAFRTYHPINPFTPDQSKRQNDLLRSAWQSLQTKEAVIAFLNTHDADLGGEPLTLALASEDGLRSAERLLGEMSLRAAVISKDP